MSADIKPGQYVTARHVDGDVVTGLVLKVESLASVLIKTGAFLVRLDFAEWELERSWRDGVYQHHEMRGTICFIRDGRAYDIDGGNSVPVLEWRARDAFDFIGRETSR